MPNDEDAKPTRVQVEPENIPLLKELADRDRRSMGQEVNWLIEQEFERRQGEVIQSPVVA